MALFGVDVSKYNGNLDYEKLKSAGVRFAFVKATQGHALSSEHYLFTDSKFERNMEGFTKAGIPVGAYHFFTASSILDGRREAEFFIEKMEKYRTPDPLWLVCDAENYGNKYLLGLTPFQLTVLIDRFCSRIVEAGFKPCVYTNTDHIRNFLELDKLDYPIWQAHYGANTSRPLDAGDRLAIHQYTSDGMLPGVVGRFDLNFGYERLAWRILEQRCGLEEQTRRYIMAIDDGADILVRLADKVVERSLKPVKFLTMLKQASLIRWHCGLNPASVERMLEYRFASDLFRKLYNAMLRG